MQITILFRVLLAAYGPFLIPSYQDRNIPQPEYKLDELLIYYAWPTSINGSFSVPLAAQAFAPYDYVILGDGLQDGPGDPVPHPDHQNTVDIINHPETAGTSFFGYIDLGVSTQNLSLHEIDRRIQAWSEMGISGIFFDDFGYDFLVTRSRQNEAVELAHSAGLPVIANGFFVDDVFGDEANAANPEGSPTMLSGSDYYLFESHQVRESCYESDAAWYAKASLLASYQDAIGFQVMSITTNSVENVYSEQDFFFSWYSAALFGHVATGWGEYLFSAGSENNGVAPYRQRPEEDLGHSILGGVIQDCSHYMRATDTGVITVDTAARFAGFFPETLVDGDADGVPDHYDACPDTPASVPVAPDGRPLADLDGDCDADLEDFGLFQLSHTGN